MKFYQIIIGVVCLVLSVINVNGQCDTSFNPSNTNVCGWEEVTFSVPNPQMGYTYYWDFGDPDANNNNESGLNDNILEGTSVIHSFTGSTTVVTSYDVTLEVYDPDGILCGTEMTTITVNTSPIPILVSGGFDQCNTNDNPDDFDLTIADGSSGNGNGAEYEINWGDGSSIETFTTFPNSISHTYSIGTFFLTLTVTDDDPSLSCNEATATYYIINGTQPSLSFGDENPALICIGDEQTFDIDDIDTNTDDTTYEILVTNESGLQVYTQENMQSVFNVTFDSISCGQPDIVAGNNTYIDSYEIIITASNACGTNEKAKRPIYVGRPPIADFTVEPESPICDQETYTFVNTSFNGVDFDGNQGCTEELNSEWTISPNTYDIVNSGATIFSDSIVVVFQTPDDYTVTLEVSNYCGTDQTTEQVCVIAIPEASFTAGNANQCAPATINFQNTSNTFPSPSSCTNNTTYNWTVSYVSGDCLPPSNGDFEFINSNATDPEVSILFSDPGEYTITLEVDNECGSDTFEEVITMAGKPSGEILMPTTVECGSADVSFEVINVSDCNDPPSFSWTFSGGANPNTATGQNSGPINFPSAGLYNVVATITNSCGEEEVIDSIYQVLEGPIATAQLNLDPNTGCIPLEVAINNNSTGDELVYDWVVSPNSGFSYIEGTDQTSAEPEFEFTVIGTYTITLNLSSDCGTDTWSSQVIVQDEPTVALDSIDPFCDAGNFTPTASYNNVDMIDVVQWSFPGGTPASFTGPIVTNSINYGSPGTYPIMVTVTNECGTDSDQIDITILSSTIADANIVDEACLDDNGTIAVSTDNTSSGDFSGFDWSILPSSGWNLQAGSTLQDDEPVFVFQDTGVYTITMNALSEACDPSVWTSDILILDGPLFILSPIDNTCDIADITPEVTYENEGRIDSVRWEFIGGTPATSTEFYPQNIVYNSPDEYTIILTSYNICGSHTESITFSILESMNADAVLTPDFGCAPLTVSTSNNSTGDNLSYDWSVISMNGGSLPSFTPNIEEPNFTFQDTGSYEITLIVSNPACPDDVWTDIVTVIGDPVVALDPIDDTCDAASFSPVAVYENEGRIDSVRWNFIGGTPSTSTDLHPINIMYDSPGDYTIEVTTYNECNSLTETQSFTILESMEANALLSDDFGCTPLDISVTDLSTGTGISYNWQVNTLTGIGNPSFTNNIADPTFSFVDTGSYEIILTVSNDACPDDIWMDTVTIINEPIVTLDPIDNTCDAANFSPIPSYTGRIDSVRWNFIGAIPNTSTELFPTNIQYDSPGNYTMSVTVYNICGTSDDSQDFTILESMEANAELSDNFGCIPLDVSVTDLSSGTGISYNWQVNALTGAGNPTFTDNIADPTFSFVDTGTYEIILTVSNEACPDDIWMDTIIVIDDPVVTLDPIDDTCDAASFSPIVIYENEGRIDSVRWNFIGGTPSTSTDLYPTNIMYDSPGDYIVEVTTYNECNSLTGTENFTILESMEANAELDTNLVCVGGIIQSTDLSSGDQLSYTWEVSLLNGGSTSSVDFDPSLINPSFEFLDTGTYVITLVVSNPICGSDSWTDTVLVLEPPVVNITPIDDFCDGADFTPIVTHNNEGRIDSIRWNFVGGTPNTSTDITPPNITYSNTGTFEIEVIVYNACGIDDDIQEFTILESMEANVELDTTFGCTPLIINATDLSTGDQLDYEWLVNPITGSANTDYDGTLQEPIFEFPDTGMYEIVLTVSNEVCGEDTWIDTITVIEAPTVTLDTIPNFCDGGEFTPVVSYNTTSGVDSVRWNFIGGTPSTSTELFPTDISYSTTGTFEINVTVYNACDSDTQIDEFTILESMEANAELDTTFGCTPLIINATDLSTGDQLDYEWLVNPITGSANTDYDGTLQEPIFEFPDTGMYEIVLTVSNEVCGEDTWIDTITVIEAPTVTLDTIPNFCDGGEFTPVVSYNTTSGVDSVRWNFIGGTPSTSTELFPTDISYSTTGTFEINVTVYNACDSDTQIDEFTILESMEANAELDTTFGCTPLIINATDLSTGDQLDYEWLVNPITGSANTDYDGTLQEPIFTFLDTGMYEIVLTVSNEVCGEDTWIDTITVIEAPTVTLDTIPNFCDGGEFTPVVSYNTTSGVDSVRWNFIGGTPSTSTELFPTDISYSTTGTFEINVTVYNACNSDTQADEFTILESMEANAELDTTFGCTPLIINATDLSTGDQLDYEWLVNPITGSANTDYDGTLQEPIFTFLDTGMYEIVLTVSNEVCGEDFWRDTVLVIEAPSVTLDAIPDFCDEATYTPIVSYSDTSRIDSIIWYFPDGIPNTSNSFNPSDIVYEGAGTYTVAVTVFNECDSAFTSQTFTIDTIPTIDLGPTDTICITDGIFMIPQAEPAGGIWAGSPAITDPNIGLFDPVIAGGGVTAIQYVYTIGVCEIIEDKDIFVVDLSFVDAGPDQEACYSDTTFVLDGGTPLGGWYEGNGVTDSLGIFNATLAGVGAHVINYYYQLPNTDCIGIDSFELIVHPLPEIDIDGLDSICINVPVSFSNNTLFGASYEWFFSDGGYYTLEEPTHTFLDTGYFDIQIIATSPFGCIDSLFSQVYVSGPPIAYFEMDTSEGCAVLPVLFDNQSIGYQYVQYDWDFANGESSNLFQPGTIEYEQATMDTLYYPNLTVTNHCGMDFHEDSVLVFPTPLAELWLSQSEGCNPLPVDFNNTTLGEPDSFFWDLGNGVTSTDSIPPSQVYLAEDSINVVYTVTLIAYNECGSDTTSQQILVKPNFVRAFFSVDENVGCEPFEVDFINTTSPDSAIVYNWYFGDGNTSNEESPTYTFYPTGDTTTQYTVILVADNGCGIDSTSTVITVHPAPFVEFDVNPIGCRADSVEFINTSIDVNGIFWDFGDGNTSIETNPYHVYQTTGFYDVELTAYSALTGCPNTFMQTIEVREIPTAAFTLTPDFGCPPLDVNFTNLSQNGSYYVWDFGDGNTFAGPSTPTHTYTESGLFDVTLQVTDIFGCQHDTIFSSIEIYPTPEASFDIVPTDSCGLPLEVCFINTSLGAVGYEWDFGNGNSSFNNQPCEDYNSEGDYLVELIVQNQYNCTDITTQSFTAFDSPLAAFSPFDTLGCEDFTVTFDNFSENNTIITWEFSDGGTSLEEDGTYTFTDPGYYSVTQYVSNGSGCEDSFTLENIIHVLPSPEAGIFFDKLDNEPPSTYQFTDASSSDVVYYWWDFDDGDTSNIENPTHRYLSSYDKEVTHVVFNEYGCSDTARVIVNLDTITGLFIPNILEPETGEKELEQVFFPQGIGLKKYHITIYSRNGELVWESNSLNEEGMPDEFWNGTFKGNKMPQGVYVWNVKTAKFLDNSVWDGMKNKDGKLATNGFLYLVR